MLITREAAVAYASLAFLFGLIMGLASCAPECAYPDAQTVASDV